MQSISSAAPQSRRTTTLLAFIIDHNPCYLLSGILMLFGCWLLNSALHTKAGDIRKLLVLLLIINLYEALLILLGLTLIKRIAFKRDGRILLGLQALFLVDVTFFTGVISTIDFAWGLLINLAVFALAALKVRIILKGLHLPGSGRMSLFILAQVFLLLMVPTFFKSIVLPTGHIPALAVYFTWWLAGLLLLLGLLLYRLPPSRRRLLDPPGVEHGMAVFFIVLPFASLLVHLYSAAWVYSIDFHPAFAAPVLLGLALAAGILESPRLQRYLILRLQVLLIAISIYLSAFPSSFSFSLSSPDGFVISPLRLTLVAIAALSIYFIWRHDSPGFLFAALLCLAAAMLGPTLPIIFNNLAALFTSTRRLVPRTTLQWGILSVSASFAMLALGAVLSLKKHSQLHRPHDLLPEPPLE